MPDFRAKMHQQSISAGAPPQTPLGVLTALPRPPSWIWGLLLRGEGTGRDGKGGEGREGEGRGKREGVGNAIPDRFANPGILGLTLLNPGITGLIPGLNRARLWLAIAGLVIGKIATTRTTTYRLNCAMHSPTTMAVKLHVSSLAHGSF